MYKLSFYSILGCLHNGLATPSELYCSYENPVRKILFDKYPNSLKVTNNYEV